MLHGPEPSGHEAGRSALPGSRQRLPRHARAVAPYAAFVLFALAFVVPALPGTGFILGGEDLYYFRPPLSELRPADITEPANALLQDPVEVFHPDLEWTFERIKNADLPLWNPAVGTGWPLLASQQTAPLFPLNLPAFVLPFWDSLALIAALRILLAAVGTFLFCRSVLRLGRGPAVLAGLTFAGGAYFISWLEHPHGNVYALLPWLLLAVDRVMGRARWPDAAAFGAVLGLAFLGGHPQSVLIDAFLVGPYAVWRATRPGQRALGPVAATLPRTLLLLAGGVAIGIAAGAVMLLPLVEFLGASATTERGGFGGIEARALLSGMLPELWGRPDGGFQGAGPINYFERTIYVGAPALLLAGAGLVVRRCPAQIFFAAMVVVGAMLAVTLPLVTPIVDNVPPFSLVAMIRALVIPSFALAILAALGLERILEAPAPDLRRALIAIAIVAVLPVAWLLAGHLDALDTFDEAVESLPLVAGEPDSANAVLYGAVLRWVPFALSALLLLSLIMRAGVTSLIVAALLLVQAIDLVELGRGLHPAVDEAVVSAGPTPPLGEAMRNQGTNRTVGSDAYLLPNEGMRFGLRDVRVRGQPTIRRVDGLYRAYSGTVPRTFLVDWPRAGALLDAFGVRQVLTGARAIEPAARQLRLVTTSLDDRLYRNRTALPRAYVATSWRRSSSEAEAIAITTSSTREQLRREPVVELPSGPRRVSRPGSGSARFLVDGDNRVTVDVSSRRAGRLVLLDAYYPGWKAAVDGRPVDIAPTNGAFRSVAVPAGRSTVEFRYRPASVYAGAVVSLATWLALLLGLIIVVWRGRRARSQRRPGP